MDLFEKGPHHTLDVEYDAVEELDNIRSDIGKFVTRRIGNKKCSAARAQAILEQIELLLTRALGPLMNCISHATVTVEQFNELKAARKAKAYLVEMQIDRTANTQWLTACIHMFRIVVARRVVTQQSFRLAGVIDNTNSTLQQLQCAFSAEVALACPGLSIEEHARVGNIKPLAKAHKGYAWRYIQASINVIKSPVSHIVYCVLTEARDHIRQVAASIEDRVQEEQGIAVKLWPIIEALQEFTINLPSNISYLFKGDMESMYERCIHTDVYAANAQLISEMYQANSNKVLWVHQTKREWVWKSSIGVWRDLAKWVRVPEDAAKALMGLDLNHALVRIGNQISKQEFGVEMGGECSPLHSTNVEGVAAFNTVKGLIDNAEFWKASCLAGLYVKADDYILVNCPETVWRQLKTSVIPRGLNLKTEHVTEGFVSSNITATKVHFLNCTVKVNSDGSYDYWPYSKSVDKKLMDNRSEPCAPHTNRQALVASFCGAISRFYTASKTVDAFVIHCLNEAIRLIIVMRVKVGVLHSKMQMTVSRLQERRPSTFNPAEGVRMFSAMLDCMLQNKWNRVTHELYCPRIIGRGAHAVAGLPEKIYRTVKYSTLCGYFHL